MTRLGVGTRVIIEGHVDKDTWHISNQLSGRGYKGRIVGYDADDNYIAEAMIKGKVRRQKVQS